MNAQPTRGHWSRVDPLVCVCTVGSLLFATLFLLHIADHPSAGDAWGYRNYAKYFRSYGFLSDFGTIRTYGYPAFLYLVSFLTGPTDTAMALGGGVAQYGLFFAAAWWLMFQVRPYGTSLRYAVAIGVLLNPLLIALVVDTLSESLTIVTFVAITGSMIAACRALTWSRAAGYLGVATALAFYAMMVRPANIVLVGALLVAIVCFIVGHPSGSGKRLPLAMVYSVYFLAAAILVFGPQFAYNLRHWSTPSFMPVCRLNQMQLTYSVVLLKAEALVRNGGALGRYYMNPWLQEPLPMANVWRWYVDHPARGLATMLMHIFASFDVHSLYTYIYTTKPLYEVALNQGFWVLNLLGVVRVVDRFKPAITALRTRTMPPEAPMILFLLALWFGTVLLTTITAVEVRFNTLPLAILSVSGSVWLLQFWAERRKGQLAILAICLLGACLAAGVSKRVEQFAVEAVPAGMLAFDNNANRCFGDFRP